MNENVLILTFQRSYENFVKIRTARQASPECSCPPGTLTFTQCILHIVCCCVRFEACLWLIVVRMNGSFLSSLCHWTTVCLDSVDSVLWRMQTADWPLHLTERKVFNSGLYIEVLRACLTCVCSLVHLEKKQKMLKFTFPTSRWKHLFLQCRSAAFWSFWDGVKVGLVSASVAQGCWREWCTHSAAASHFAIAFTVLHHCQKSLGENSQCCCWIIYIFIYFYIL